jgi:hypothetical protein
MMVLRESMMRWIICWREGSWKGKQRRKRKRRRGWCPKVQYQLSREKRHSRVSSLNIDRVVLKKIRRRRARRRRRRKRASRLTTEA